MCSRLSQALVLHHYRHVPPPICVCVLGGQRSTCCVVLRGLSPLIFCYKRSHWPVFTEWVRQVEQRAPGMSWPHLPNPQSWDHTAMSPRLFWFFSDMGSGEINSGPQAFKASPDFNLCSVALSTFLMLPTGLHPSPGPSNLAELESHALKHFPFPSLFPSS